MQQGNHFDENLEEDAYGFFVRVPLEISFAVCDASYLTWISNGNGTYTLVPKYGD